MSSPGCQPVVPRCMSVTHPSPGVAHPSSGQAGQNLGGHRGHAWSCSGRRVPLGSVFGFLKSCHEPVVRKASQLQEAQGAVNAEGFSDLDSSCCAHP